MLWPKYTQLQPIHHKYIQVCFHSYNNNNNGIQTDRCLNIENETKTLFQITYWWRERNTFYKLFRMQCSLLVHFISFFCYWFYLLLAFLWYFFVFFCLIWLGWSREHLISKLPETFCSPFNISSFFEFRSCHIYSEWTAIYWNIARKRLGVICQEQ